MIGSLIAKKINGGTYWYLREVARVGGRPKIVSTRYLGKAEDIAAMLDGATSVPERTQALEFGDLAAVWTQIQRLGVVESIDRVVGTSRKDAQASVGTYLALTGANRVVAPCSKLAFSDWWQTTVGPRLVKMPKAALDHRRFWDAMDQVTEDHLVEIERELRQRMVSDFGVDLSGQPGRPAPLRSRREPAGEHPPDRPARQNPHPPGTNEASASGGGPIGLFLHDCPARTTNIRPLAIRPPDFPQTALRYRPGGTKANMATNQSPRYPRDAW